MIQTKLRVSPFEPATLEEQLAIPIAVPEMKEIRELANQLHFAGVEYDGEVWGWMVHYDPELPEPPPDSQLTFTPAFFWIGVWPMWYVSFTWEAGHDQEPSVLVGEDNLVRHN